jgi:sn-glycerol 3-phosphate transport system substrate-binding protein
MAAQKGSNVMNIHRRTVLGAAGAFAATRARAAEKVHIVLWHAMSAALGEELNKLVTAFNGSQDSVEVTPLFKGAYKDLMTAVVAAYRAGQAPHIAQVFEIGTQTMLSSGPVIKPVWQLAQETGVKIDANAYIPAVRGYYSTPDGKLASMPFNSSTAISWYNLDVLEKAGIDTKTLPATWQEVENVMRTVRQKDAAPYGVTIASMVWSQFEQYGAIHNLSFATEANGFKGLDAVLKVNSPAYVKHLQRLIDMAKDNSFHYTGRDGVGDGAFLNGQSAMACSTSALRGDLKRSAKFRWAAAYLPYDPDVLKQPINSAIGGASFWVLTAPKRDLPEYRGVAQFLHFLGQPQQDAQWSMGTGYVPVTHAGYELLAKQGWFEQNPGTDVPVKQLTRGQVTDNSRGFHLGRMPEIRTIIEEECEKSLAGQQSAKQALDSAVERGNKVLRDFQKSVRT